jgi:dihydrofolate synthase/folylpolyglutamate synthase
MNDKDVARIAKVLFPKTGTIVLTQPDNTRAMTAVELANLIPSEIGNDRLARTGSVSEAIGFAQEVSPADGIILITGSLYLVGEARRILTRPSEQV